MGSKFWRQLIFAEGILILGMALGWVLAPYLGPWHAVSLIIVTVIGLVLVLGVIFWQARRGDLAKVRKKFRLGQPVDFESLRKALRAHGVQPDLVHLSSLNVKMLRLQNRHEFTLNQLTLLTLYNEGPESIKILLEGEEQILDPDHWLRVGPFAKEGKIELSTSSDSKSCFVLMHSLLLPQGLD